MDINNTNTNKDTFTNKRFELHFPHKRFRAGWLVFGLIIGWVLYSLNVQSVTIFVLLAVITGISANWSSWGCAMVSTISPVVYRDSDLGYIGWLISASFYTIGSIIGGVLIGALLSLANTFLFLILEKQHTFFTFIIGFAAISYAMHEFQLMLLPHPQVSRQVPSHWRYLYHPYITALFYGLLLGAGFVTFIPTGSYYILVLVTSFNVSPIIGISLFGIYGFTRALILWIFSWKNNFPGTIEDFIYYMDLTKPVMRQINGFVLALLGAYMVMRSLF